MEPNSKGYLVVGSGMGVKQNNDGHFDFAINLIGLEQDENHNVYFTQNRAQTCELYEYLKSIFEKSHEQS